MWCAGGTWWEMRITTGCAAATPAIAKAATAATRRDIERRVIGDSSGGSVVAMRLGVPRDERVGEVLQLGLAPALGGQADQLVELVERGEPRQRVLVLPVRRIVSNSSRSARATA